MSLSPSTAPRSGDGDEAATASLQASIEVAAEDVAEARQYIIELDRRQHQLREARRRLTTSPCHEDDLWLLCSASTFVRSDRDPAQTLAYLSWRLREGEAEMAAARAELKRKVAALATLEGPDSALARLYAGFDLEAVS